MKLRNVVTSFVLAAAPVLAQGQTFTLCASDYKNPVRDPQGRVLNADGEKAYRCAFEGKWYDARHVYLLDERKDGAFVFDGRRTYVRDHGMQLPNGTIVRPENPHNLGLQEMHGPRGPHVILRF